MDRSIYRRKCLERLIAAHSLNFKRKLNMIYLVESSCSTHRAAELLQISVSKIRLPSFAVVIVMLWAIGFVGDEGRSLFYVEGIGDRVLWVLRGDRCLI